MASGPGYTVSDLAFWSGFILGTAVTHVFLMNLPAYFEVLDQMGALPYVRVITLVIAVLVGGAVGGAALAAWNKYKEAKKAAPPDEDYRKDYHEDRDEHDPRR